MSEDTAEFYYRVYGLTVASEIELPELSPLTNFPGLDEDSVDLRIELARVDDHLPGQAPSKAWASRHLGNCLIKIPDIARYMISDGKKIVVDVEPKVSHDDARVFLLGSAFAAVMHYRGMIPLHISSILTPGGVVAFTGESGAGKSTLAAHLNRSKQWPLISDDVSCARWTADGTIIESGVNTMKLWDDALNSLGRTSEGLRRDLTRYDKFHAIDPAKFIVGKHTLKRLIFLKWGDEFRFEKLEGFKAFEAVLGAVYRPELAKICGNRNNVTTAAMNIANDLDIRLMVRSKNQTVQENIEASIMEELID